MALRRALLHLHKTLLDSARYRYERQNGAVSSQRMLHLLLHDPQFQWLRPLSEAIVRLDEVLENDLVAHEPELATLLDELRGLLGSAAAESAFGLAYRDALQHSPDAVLAHRDVTQLLADKSAKSFPGSDNPITR
jgi:hypothetical protein